jgi:hypothetical protein
VSRATQQTELAVANVDTAGKPEAIEPNIGNGSHERKIVCAQSWPYYEPACLRDGRQSNGSPRVVRVIAHDRTAAIRPR